ncbi:tyrosine-protein kinase Yes-like [Haliotis rubra]|uniref:tyrosine-protein kinase Yes-like n=1 Tax=Haliotis rubra TaxID=36100 RepID=UPI001EE4FB6E|nr:tyrosine-protein kinase Yes-like [Haliotis rubra]
MNADELSFEEGEQLKYIQRGNDEEWILCCNKSGRKGYVPLSHVVRQTEDSSIKVNDWWFVGSREDAEMVLLNYHHGKATGIFLVREASDKSGYVLCVRAVDVRNKAVVNHYRIYGSTQDGFNYKQYYFPTIQELIEHFKGTSQ